MSKPIEAGCLALVIIGNDTGKVVKAVSRVRGETILRSGQTPFICWGWTTDPEPEDDGIGYYEKALMRLDDPDLQKEIEQEQVKPLEVNHG